MYVCPKCKGELSSFACAACGVTYKQYDSIPYFLSPAGSESAPVVGAIYDSIYSDHSNVWEDQGRDERFRQYFASLVESISPGRHLEVGCGEGLLLATMKGEERYGIDPSIEALQRAKQLSSAHCSAAQAEYLPFRDEYFSSVSSVGVMEHFSDPEKATREVFRVLKNGGVYVVLIHTDMSRLDRLRLKVKEYLYPSFHPIACIGWAWKKIYKPIRQPMRRSYSVASAISCLASAGFSQIRTVTLQTNPQAPLAGTHVAIFVAEKRAN